MFITNKEINELINAICMTFIHTHKEVLRYYFIGQFQVTNQISYFEGLALNEHKDSRLRNGKYIISGAKNLEFGIYKTVRDKILIYSRLQFPVHVLKFLNT
jgi:hypothetical protein